MQVLNFYSTVFADQMKRGRKTATIRLGDKRHKYRKNQVVLVTVGYQYSPREKLFHAVIDNVEVKRVKDLSPRDIEHDNPEFRRTEELVHFLKQIYDREVALDDTVTVGYQYSPREKLFHAVIDNVEVKRVKDLSPRDIEHDNPEFRRTEELVHFLKQIYDREVALDDTVTVVRFSQIVENPPDFQDRLRGVGGAQN